MKRADHGRYILNGHTPVVEPDLLRWSEWFGRADRRVAWTRVGKQQVSTVFLGIDHNFGGGGPPLLFETMVFPEGKIQKRCSTWEEAERQHAGVAARLTRKKTA